MKSNMYEFRVVGSTSNESTIEGWSLSGGRCSTLSPPSRRAEQFPVSERADPMSTESMIFLLTFYSLIAIMHHSLPTDIETCLYKSVQLQVPRRKSTRARVCHRHVTQNKYTFLFPPLESLVKPANASTTVQQRIDLPSKENDGLNLQRPFIANLC